MKTCSSLLVALLLAAGTARADWVVATVPAGADPHAIAVNPVTGRIYVVNSGSDDLTVIDPATGDTSLVRIGARPRAVAVNPVTNRIYVANQGSDDVTVVDGNDNSATTVPAGTGPRAVVVNPATNRIYVANQGSDDVTVIDGTTGETSRFPAGAGPVALAVNPVTGRVYVANAGSDEMTVFDPATGDTNLVATGAEPVALAVDPVANRIYVANAGSDDVTVVDGGDNSTITVPAGSDPRAVAVDPVADRAYVANAGSDEMTIIEGATGDTSLVAAGPEPVAVAVNPVTGKVYLANRSGAGITVFDPATGATGQVPAGIDPVALAVNPATNRIYVANQGSASVTVVHGASHARAEVPAGTHPWALAVNPVTNRIYVANQTGNDVTVIDGTGDEVIATVAAGGNPVALAVNPATNRIYVANRNTDNVTVIDGASNATTAVPAGTDPVAVAVNPVTNRIYVANQGSNDLTVIDGADNSRARVPVGSEPVALAVNPATNRIYVANRLGDNLTVVDGATNETATVPAGVAPAALAVNPAAGRVYVANQGGDVTVIDAAADTVLATVTAGSWPRALAVDPVTGRVYVANYASHDVTVIDGATNAVIATVPAGVQPLAVAVDPVAGMVYVANRSGHSLTVIDGATSAATAVPTGDEPFGVAVNPVTGKVYAANRVGNSVTAVTCAPRRDTKVLAGFLPDPRHLATEPRPELTGKAVNRQEPGRTAMHRAFTRLATVHRGWSETATTGGAGTDSLTWEWQWGEDSLGWGENLLCVLPLDLGTGTTNNLGLGTPYTGNLLVYPLLRVAMLTPPDPPVAQYPPDGGSVTSLTPTLRVAFYPGAEQFEFRVWQQLVLIASGFSPDRDWVVSTPLVVGETYEWDARVRVNGVWSAYFTPRRGFSVFETPFGPGWTELSPMPAEPGSRKDVVLRGAFLAVGPCQPVRDDETRVIYATKGNKNQDFYCYDPVGDTWTRLTDIPAHNGRRVERGSRGVYAPGAEEGTDLLYVVSGNNTDGFMAYDIAECSWAALAPVPPGPSGKRVKGGGDLLHVDGYIYLLKGYQNEFLRYCIATGEWEPPLQSPPAERFRRDSWLVTDNEGSIYLHQSRDHGFWRYDVERNAWPEALPGMPLAGDHGGKQRNKKARDGSSAAYLEAEGSIYALKGGKTTMFYRFDLLTRAWVELPGIPREGSSLKPRRVGAGADLVYYEQGTATAFFALKGNRTTELWCFVPGSVAVQEPPAAPGRPALTIRPNPVAGGFATLRYSLPGTGPVAVTVYDVAGRSVLSDHVPDTPAAGSLALDLRGLGAGVYVVQVSAAGQAAAQKLVVTR